MQRKKVPIGCFVSEALCSVLLGFANFDVKPWNWKALECQGTCRPVRHGCDTLTTKSGFQLLTDVCVEKQFCEIVGHCCEVGIGWNP